MKNNIIILLLIVGSLKGMTQDTTRMNDTSSHQARGLVPVLVWQSFKKDYPNAKHPQWQHLRGKWIATYKDQDHGGYQVNTYYDSLGHQLEKHIELKKQDTPSAVKEQIQNSYHSVDYDITRIERSGQPVLYQIALKLSNGRTVIYMDQQGRQIPFKDNLN